MCCWTTEEAILNEEKTTMEEKMRILEGQCQGFLFHFCWYINVYPLNSACSRKVAILNANSNTKTYKTRMVEKSNMRLVCPVITLTRTGPRLFSRSCTEQPRDRLIDWQTHYATKSSVAMARIIYVVHSMWPIVIFPPALPARCSCHEAAQFGAGESGKVDGLSTWRVFTCVDAAVSGILWWR